MRAVAWKVRLTSDGCHRQHVRRSCRILNLATSITRRGDTSDAALLGFLNFLLYQERDFVGPQAEINEVYAAVDALIEGVDEVAVTAPGEDLKNMNFGCRRETAHRRTSYGPGRNNAGTVGAMSDLVQCPAEGLLAVGDVGARGDVL